MRSEAPTGRPGEPPVLASLAASPWAWRALAVATLVAAGLCATFFLDGHTAYGAAWALVATAWATFTALLWHRHLAGHGRP